MIDKATENLKNTNPSGLDRRLLLPSVEAKSSESEETQGQQLFKSINQMTATLSDKNDIIIDQLVELNATQKRILSEGGGGGKENMLQTLLALPKRAAASVVKGGQSALQAGTNLLMSPLNLAKGAISGVGSAIASPFKGVGNAVGNLFQSKNLKALTEINRDQLTEQTAIREAAEDIAVKVEEIAGMMEQDLKIRRRGRLDALEAKRDGRSGPGGRAGLIGGSALAAGGVGGAGDDDGLSLRDGTLVAGGAAATTLLGKTKSIFNAGIDKTKSIFNAGMNQLNKINPFKTSKPITPPVVPNKPPSAPNLSNNPPKSGLLRTMTKFIPGAAALASSGLGVFDPERKDAGMDLPSRGMSGVVQGLLTLPDMAINAPSFLGNLFGGDFEYPSNLAGGFRDTEIANAKERQSSRQIRSREKALNKTYRTRQGALAAAEENNVVDYTIKEVEVRKKRILGGPDIVKKGFKIEKTTQQARRDMNFMDINQPSPGLLSGKPGEGIKNFLTARDKAQDLSERSGVEFGVEKIINPQPFDDSVLGYQIKRKEAIIPALQAGVDNAGTNINVTPITDNRTSNTTTNNNTMISKMNLSSVDQTNKVVPI